MLRLTAGVLLLAVTLNQALTVLHGHDHTHTPSLTECGLCRLSAEPARVAAGLDDVLGPYTFPVDGAAPPSAPYVRPVHGKRVARGPPLSGFISESS